MKQRKRLKKPTNDVCQTDGLVKPLMDIADGFASRWWEHHKENLREASEAEKEILRVFKEQVETE